MLFRKFIQFIYNPHLRRSCYENSYLINKYKGQKECNNIRRNSYQLSPKRQYVLYPMKRSIINKRNHFATYIHR